MDKAPELQGKYTIFGKVFSLYAFFLRCKVTGDSLFNVLKMNDLQVDDNDRPLYPAKIESVSIGMVVHSTRLICSVEPF